MAINIRLMRGVYHGSYQVEIKERGNFTPTAVRLQKLEREDKFMIKNTSFPIGIFEGQINDLCRVARETGINDIVFPLREADRESIEDSIFWAYRTAIIQANAGMMPSEEEPLINIDEAVLVQTARSQATMKVEILYGGKIDRFIAIFSCKRATVETITYSASKHFKHCRSLKKSR